MVLFGHGPKSFLHAPHLKNLAENSVCFPTCYTGSPLCAPGRASFMSGQLPSRTRVYDNAAEFASSIPTYAHHLRRHGYHTILAGKMHYVGPDQLHGFETRTTTDIYPADFGWTPDYRKPGERIDWWYHNLARSPAPVLPKSATRWNMMMKSRIARCRRFISLGAVRMTALGA